MLLYIFILSITVIYDATANPFRRNHRMMEQKHSVHYPVRRTEIGRNNFHPIRSNYQYQQPAYLEAQYPSRYEEEYIQSNVDRFFQPDGVVESFGHVPRRRPHYVYDRRQNRVPLRDSNVPEVHVPLANAWDDYPFGSAKHKGVADAIRVPSNPVPGHENEDHYVRRWHDTMYRRMHYPVGQDTSSFSAHRVRPSSPRVQISSTNTNRGNTWRQYTWQEMSFQHSAVKDGEVIEVSIQQRYDSSSQTSTFSATVVQGNVTTSFNDSTAAAEFLATIGVNVPQFSLSYKQNENSSTKRFRRTVSSENEPKLIEIKKLQNPIETFDRPQEAQNDTAEEVEGREPIKTWRISFNINFNINQSTKNEDNGVKVSITMSINNETRTYNSMETAESDLDDLGLNLQWGNKEFPTSKESNETKKRCGRFKCRRILSLFRHHRIAPPSWNDISDIRKKFANHQAGWNDIREKFRNRLAERRHHYGDRLRQRLSRKPRRERRSINTFSQMPVVVERKMENQNLLTKNRSQSKKESLDPKVNLHTKQRRLPPHPSVAKPAKSVSRESLNQLILQYRNDWNNRFYKTDGKERKRKIHGIGRFRGYQYGPSE